MISLSKLFSATVSFLPSFAEAGTTGTAVG